MIDVSKTVRKILIDKDIKQGELGERLGMSKQVMSDYMRRQDYRINADIVRIADALGLDVTLTLTDRETGKTYIID